MAITRDITRRAFIKTGMALAAGAAMPGLARASVTGASRSVHLYNVHTGESLKTVYWENGEYLTEPLKDIYYVLRDYRTNDMQPISSHLLDVIAALHTKLGSHKAFEVISGYRSPRTNAMLHAHSAEVAVNSLHMYGKAIDIRLPDKTLNHLRRAAWDMQQGGVGYYPSSGFVHVDIGPVNHWQG